jgi:hypothetical protein
MLPQPLYFGRFLPTLTATDVMPRRISSNKQETFCPAVHASLTDTRKAGKLGP